MPQKNFDFNEQMFLNNIEKYSFTDAENYIKIPLILKYISPVKYPPYGVTIRKNIGIQHRMITESFFYYVQNTIKIR